MSSSPAQLVDPHEFIPILDCHFLGDEVTVEKKRMFIIELRKESTVFHAAQHARISRKTAYQWREHDPDFAEAWNDAREDAIDIMEHSVYHQALNGDTLLKMFWLKKHRPEYRDKTTIDIQVIQSEISERMQALNLKQLPPMDSHFTDSVVPACGSQTAQSNQASPAIPTSAAESAKRDETAVE